MNEAMRHDGNDCHESPPPLETFVAKEKENKGRQCTRVAVYLWSVLRILLMFFVEWFCLGFLPAVPVLTVIFFFVFNICSEFLTNEHGPGSLFLFVRLLVIFFVFELLYYYEATLDLRFSPFLLLL